MFLLLVCNWLLSPELFQFLIIALIVKFGIELIIAMLGTKYFKKTKWIWFFPILFVFYMPYALIISFFSIFGNFKWKNRVYNQGKVK